MNLHEYQTKILLREYGLSIPDFAVVSNEKELTESLASMQLEQAVLKIQVHAGGRGKGGGVKLAKNKEEIVSYAKQLFGMKLINDQTGPEGVIAHQLLITPLIAFKKEYYVAAVIDRKTARAILIASAEGGMEIEELALNHPEKILTVPIELNGALRSYHLLALNKWMGWTGQLAVQGKLIFKGLAKAFIELDASLLEVNPLVETVNGELIALDAKLSIDENALFRQQRLAALADLTQLGTQEAQAKKQDLAYVSLQGEIGCMVNGAGLAMATMDIIHHFGGKPANFLDVGGSATQERIAEGFKIILSDTHVKAILVNIFGGIMNCATLAAGIIAAAAKLELTLPLIVRMEGTNVEQGKKMLAESTVQAIFASDLAQAAQLAVQAAHNR